MSTTYEDILALRAIRSFSDEPLSDEHVLCLLEAARWTGSSKNNQAWSYVLVRDTNLLAKLAETGSYTDPIRNSVATLVLVKEQGGNDFDIGRMAQNVMLAAASLGVASCPVTLHRSADAADVLGLPDGASSKYAIALGYPAEDAEPARWGGRKQIEQIAHFETY